MFSSGILDVAVGLVFVYFIMSLVCSSLNEILAQLVASRSRYLRMGIENMFDRAGAPALVVELFEHPLIKSLSRKGKSPSYIASRSVALALFELVVRGTKGGLTYENLKAQLESERAEKLFGPSLASTMRALVCAGDDLDGARKLVEKWFDDTMDRVGGWYRRRAQQIILLLAFALAVIGNVDTIALARGLSTDPATRAELVAAADGDVVEEKAGASEPETAAKGIALAKKVALPIGWTARGTVPATRGAWLEKICGLIFTALAVSLGAPFWFQLLQKLLRVEEPAKEKES